MRKDTKVLTGPWLPPDYTPEEFDLYQELGGGSIWSEDNSEIYKALKGHPELQFIISYCFENRHKLVHAANALNVSRSTISGYQNKALRILADNQHIKKLLTRRYHQL